MCNSSDTCEHVQLATSFGQDLSRQFNAERAKTARLTKALQDIAAWTDASKPDSYRNEDRSKCLAAIHETATSALN